VNRRVIIFGVIVLLLVMFSLSARTAAMTISSTEFNDGAPIPPRFTCSGSDQSPPLSWNGAPGGTRSYVLLVEDPDAPSGTFVHWVVFNIPATENGMPEGTPTNPRLTNGAIQGTNGFNVNGYKGPCPPPGGPHHYHFKLYALDAMLDLTAAADERMVQSNMSPHVKATAELVGTFSR
jgi:Raf kinase inhibitor-like YbhB/YbcL family protein